MLKKCVICDKDVEVTSIQNFSDYSLESLSCGHSSRAYSRTIAENVAVSDTASWVIIKDPIGEIKEAKDKKDYYKLFSYACSVFEYYGRQILVWQFNKNNTPVSKDKLQHITLETIIVMLYTHKIIDQPTYTKIIEVKNFRNDFIHENYSVTYTPAILKDAESKSKFAFESIETLKKVYDSFKPA